MPNRIATLLLSPWIMMAHVALAATSSNVSATASDAWLMMVATRCTDPARDAEFNAWYNDIDIPDVLEVPGYQRARRGLRLGTAAAPVSALPDTEGRYVALYDIASGNIDKTIIEMLMATRKMESRGRSTDLLAVTERVYYLRLAPTVERSGATHVTGGNKPSDDASGAAGGSKPQQDNDAASDEYLYVERLDCCADTEIEARFNEWYDHEHVATVLARPGFERATRYELYRVLMNEPKEASRYLTVYELRTRSPEEAAKQMEATRSLLRDHAHTPASVVERDSLMFRKIRDVRR
jgi:hypothetical protein